MLAQDRAITQRDRLAFDRASARSFDAFGRMHVANCRISKANVCPYYGREIPNYVQLGLDANRVYMLYRDPAELEKAAPSFRNSQLLMVHSRVDARDAKREMTVGTVGTVAFDGTYLVADQLTIWAQEGISLVQSEDARELSCGYGYTPDMTPGQTPEGVAYDGVMRDIMANHVALVRDGRAGPDVIVSDSHPLELPKMFKRPLLLAQLIAGGLVAAPTDEAGLLALDTKLADLTAKDGEAEEMEDDPENPGVKRKKAKGTAGEPGKVLASDAQIDAAIVAKGYVTAAAAQQMANDAALRATNDAVTRVNALHVAREAVKPLVGVVAMDSADAVYRFALEQSKVALDGVPPAAYPALVDQVVQRKVAAPLATPTRVASADASSAISKAVPGLSRIAIG